MSVSSLSDGQEWGPISLADQVRHEHLFYSQEPVEGYLAAEKTRDLFLQSKLPLLKLSQIWILADMGKDNMLDVAEFTIAMHLIQGLLQGKSLPKVLPDFLQLPSVQQVLVPVIEDRERAAYQAVFSVEDTANRGFVDGKCAYPVFLESRLPLGELALIWDLADHDASGTLDKEEFAVACHMLKYAKEGNKIEGPVDFLSLAPAKALPGTLLSKNRRLAVMEKQKTSLMALKERRKAQAERENKRVELKKEKVRLAIQKHKLFKASSSSEGTGGFQEKLQDEQDKVKKLEAVAARLKKEHEKVRQQTVKIILDEQKLSAEVNKQEAEAKRVRQMLSLSKEHKVVHDLDPFHQLYEQRKEAKENGTELPVSERKVEIPFVFDPFDKVSFEKPRIKGEDIFNLRKQAEAEETWGGASKGQVCNDYGFDDNFVNTWAPREALTTPDDVFGEEDTVFKTVPVSLDEDELWCSIPDLTGEEVQSLNQQWDSVKTQEEALQQGGDQLVFKNPADYTAQPEEQVETRTRPSYNRRSYAGVTPQRIPGEFADPLDRFAKYRRRSANIETLRKEANDITETPVRDQDFKYSRRKFRSEEDLLSDTKDTTPTASCSTLHVQHLDLNEGASRKLKSEEKLNTSEPGTSILINTEKESDSEDSEFILKPKEAEYSKPVLKEQITIANTCQDSEERKETDSTNEKSTPEIKEFVLSHPGQTPEKISTAQSQGEGNKPKQQPIPAPRTSLILQSNQSDIHQDQKQSITKETESEVVPVKIPVEEAPKPKPVSTEQQWKNNNKPTSPPSQGSDKEASKSNSISSSDSSKHQSHLASAEPRKAPVKPDRPKRKAKLQKLQQDSLGTTTLGSTSSSPGSTSPSLSPSPSPLFLDSSSSDPMKTSHEEKEPKGQSTEASVTSKPTTYLHIVSPPKFTSPGSASQAISWKSVGYLPQTSPTRDFPPPLAPNSTDTNAKSCQEDEIIPQVAKSRVEHPVDIEKEVTNIELNPVTSEEEQDMENKKACRDELANLRAQFFADMDSVADQSFDFVPTLVTATGGARVRSSGSVSEDEIQPVSIKRKVSPTGQKEEEEDKLGVEEHRILPVMQEHDASLPNLHDMEEGVEEDQIQSEVAQRRDISHMEQVGDIVLLPVEHVVLNEAAPSHGQNGLTEPQELQGYSLDGSIDDVKEDFPVARSHSPVSIEEEPISPIALVKKDPTIFIDNTLNFIVNDSGNDHSDRSVAVVEENKQAGIEMLAELVADDAYARAVIQNGGIHSSNGKDDITEDDGVKEDHIIKEIKSELKPDINFPVETGIPVSDGSEIEQDETEDGTAVHISREYFPENQCKSVPDLTELDEPEEICEKTLPESQDFQQSQQKSSEYFPENQCKSVPDLTALDQTNVVLTSTGDVISGRDEVEPAMADEYFPENQCKSVPDLTALDQTNVVLTSTGDVISGRDEVEPAIADEYFPENQCKSVPDLTELDSPPVKKITDTPEYFPENQCKSIPDFQAMDSSQQQTSGDNQGTDVPKATGREEYFPENQCKSIPDLVGLGEMTQGNNKPGINIQDPGQKPDEVVSPLSPVQPAKFTLGGDDDSPTIIPPDVISFGTTQSKTTSIPPKPPRNTKAIDKAMEIAREVEPSHVFHKEEVEVTSGENELEKERKQLISQMKVRRKKVATWKGVPESPPMPATSGKPLNSMKRYEERKKQIQKPQPDVIPKTKAQGEVESHSIRDQDLTKKHWEEKLAEEEEKKSFRKQHKHKNHEGEHDNRLKEESFISEDGLKYRDEMIQDEKNIKSLDTDNDKYASESAIDREIRLATEREERLRKEREDRLLELHLKPTPHSVQSKQPPAKQQTTSAKSPTNAGGDSWSSKPMSSAESSVVQDQHEERHIMKRQGLSQPVPGYEKEQQQSEFERQEKEEERLSAHESIVEREIRLQREREEIIARERERAYQQKIEESKKKTSPPTSSAPHKEKSQAASGGSLKLHISSPVASTTKPAVKTSSAPSGETMAEGKHFAHPGESRIARELREQREREEEIQRLRRQMSGSQGKASDCGDQDEADTKSVDVPQQPSGTWQKEVKPFKREGYSFSANSTDSAHSTGTNTSYSALHASSVQNDTVTSPRSPKVKPFQDVEPQNSYKYVPQPETPIERDIRIAREREEELRKTHTSPKLPLPAEREVVIIEKGVPQKTPDHSDGHNGVTLRTKPKGNSTNTQEKFTFRKSQNLTESKIHQELEEMQQREQELKKLRQSTKQVTDGSASKKPIRDNHVESPPAKTVVPPAAAVQTEASEGSNTLKRRSRLAQEWEEKFGKS